VRVPISVAILLCLSLVAGLWWHGTRGMDFMAPPSQAELESIRSTVQGSLRDAKVAHVAVSSAAPARAPIPPPDVLEPKPAIELGDLKTEPVIHEYTDLAGKGAEHLINLAVLLETEGEFQRSLLAWERVLDSGKPDATQTAAAVQAIKRLRPTLPDWNSDPARRIAVTLHAGTGRRTATTLKPVLESMAKEIEKASSGVLQVTAKITAGKDPRKVTGPAPVALWFGGAAEKSRSTEVLSFTVASNEKLADEVRKTAFEVVRGYVGKGLRHSQPPPLFEGETVSEALNSHITRMLWREMGTLLNHPPEKSD
jgi:hypothetical protein